MLHLEGDVAFPDSSVFEGERVSTEAEGKLGIRAGPSVLTLGERTEVWRIPLNGGLHVEVSQGALHFTSGDHEPIEIHMAEAIVGSTVRKCRKARSRCSGLKLSRSPPIGAI